MALQNYKKAIDLSLNNKPIPGAVLSFWGVSRVVIRIDSQEIRHAASVAGEGIETARYAYPWYWTTAQKNLHLSPDVFLDIEPPASGLLTLRQVAQRAAKLAAGEPWDVYANQNGLTEYFAAGGKAKRIWLAQWKYSLPSGPTIAALLTQYWMVQIAPGNNLSSFPWNWAGAGLVDLSVY